jgi:hypothetical protein
MRNYPADMKASDADRDAVLSDLSEHFQAGRLTADEFEDRTGQALAARTWGELNDLLRDLPTALSGPRAPVPAAPSATGPASPAGRWSPAPLAVLTGIAIVVAVSVGVVHNRWGFLWLVVAGLFVARRLTWCSGSSRHSGPTN